MRNGRLLSGSAGHGGMVRDTTRSLIDRRPRPGLRVRRQRHRRDVAGAVARHAVVEQDGGDVLRERRNLLRAAAGQSRAGHQQHRSRRRERRTDCRPSHHGLTSFRMPFAVSTLRAATALLQQLGLQPGDERRLQIPDSCRTWAARARGRRRSSRWIAHCRSRRPHPAARRPRRASPCRRSPPRRTPRDRTTTPCWRRRPRSADRTGASTPRRRGGPRGPRSASRRSSPHRLPRAPRRRPRARRDSRTRRRRHPAPAA